MQDSTGGTAKKDADDRRAAGFAASVPAFSRDLVFQDISVVLLLRRAFSNFMAEIFIGGLPRLRIGLRFGPSGGDCLAVLNVEEITVIGRRSPLSEKGAFSAESGKAGRQAQEARRQKEQRSSHCFSPQL